MAKKEAQRVRRGDRVSVRGESREVKAVRTDRASSDGSVILVFKAGGPMRVRADERLDVDRDGRGTR